MPNQHARTANPLPQAPEPTHAERARTLVAAARTGTLSTVSRKRPGHPFGSVMPFGLDGQGQPLYLISSMAMHTQNLQADSRASLLVVQPGAGDDVLGASRVTLMGEAVKVPDEERTQVREQYLTAYADAKYWVDFDDFAFYRMPVSDLYFVGGFGVMGWVAADDYAEAEPDPLLGHAAAIRQHMNADHAGALALLARAEAKFEASDVEMTAIDRLGFHIRAKTAQGMKGARIAFPHEVRTSQQAREAFVEMTKRARARG